jgi:hypothetical protein
MPMGVAEAIETLVKTASAAIADSKGDLIGLQSFCFERWSANERGTCDLEFGAGLSEAEVIEVASPVMEGEVEVMSG